MATTSPPATTIETDLARLAEHYEFRNRDDIVDFVREHPEVVGPLLDGVEVVPRYFGSEAPLALKVEWARESDGRPELIALIGTDMDVDASLTALRRFDEEWWLDAMPRTGYDLIFSLDPSDCGRLRLGRVP